MMKKFFTLILLFVSLFSFSQCENDETNPYFVGFQPEPTATCFDDLSTFIPVALDECDDSVEIAWYEEITSGYCSNSYDIFRVYRAFDDNGNQSVESQIIHVVDEMAPEFIFLPQDTTVGCGEPFIFTSPIVQDDCGQTTMTYETITSDSVSDCYFQSTRIWFATDECGNTNITSQTITFQDNTPPVITGSVYIELESGQPVDSIYVTATDDCSQVTLTYTDTEVSGGNIIRNYTAIDNCGNVSTFEQILHPHHTPPGDDDDDDDNNNRVAICHNLGNGNWITIYVAEPAVQAHLNHGDTLGPCNSQQQIQYLPEGMKLEITPDGEIRKYQIRK
jgi:hypothetical protein